MKKSPWLRVIAVIVGFGTVRIFAAETAGEAKPVVAPADPASTSKNKASASTEAKSAKRPLEKGMSAETILGIVGKPTEVRPMPAPDGKAEMWIYRKQAGQKSVQVVVGERDVPAFTGVGQPGNDSVGTRKELIYGQKLVTIYRVTSLLMFNGQLALARQTQEQSDSYE